MGSMMRIAVIGAGLMGRAAVLDLADDSMSPGVEMILVADINEIRAKEVYEEAIRLTNSKEIEYRKINATSKEEVVNTLKGFEADVVLNAALYTTIPTVMKASLEVGSHYLDLGDDVDTLIFQRSLDPEFKEKGLVALVEMGGSPGLINIMASKAVEELDRVDEIILREGWIDLNDYDSLGIPLPVPYSFDTILDELEQPVEIWRNGKIEKVQPFSGREIMEFPDPVGKQELYYVEHPEVYSLGETFKEKGLKFVDYKLSFPHDLLLKYRLLNGLKLTYNSPMKVDGVEIIPRDLLRRIVAQTIEDKEIKPNDYDVMKVIAKGWRGGTKSKVTIEALIRWSERWKVSAQALLVGSPASIAAQWIGLGILDIPGVHYPEEAISPIPFLREVRKRGIILTEKIEFSL